MAHVHGMSMDGANTTMGAIFHFAPGDTIWFNGWAPSSAGAVAGAAIGLFLLAIVERWLAAMRAVMEAWAKKQLEAAIAAHLSRPTTIADKVSEEGHSTVEVNLLVEQRLRARTSAPFMLSHDLSRGVLHAVHTAIQYALMLAVMTFQGAYIITICLGAGFGEVLFGRYGRGAHMH